MTTSTTDTAAPNERIARALGWRWEEPYRPRAEQNRLISPSGKATVVWRDGVYGGDLLPDWQTDANTSGALVRHAATLGYRAVLTYDERQGWQTSFFRGVDEVGGQAHGSGLAVAVAGAFLALCEKEGL